MAEQTEEFEDVNVKDIMGDITGERNDAISEEEREAQEKADAEKAVDEDAKEEIKATETEENEFAVPPEVLETLGIEEEVKVETPPEIESEFPTPEGLEEKAANAFQSMRQELHELRGKTPAQADTEAVVQLRTELEETRGRLAQHDLAEDPTFRKNYDQPIAQQVRLAQNYLQQFEGDPKLVGNFARMPMKERLTALSDQFPAAAGILAGVFSQIDALSLERSQALKEHAVTKSNLAAERERRTVASFDDSLKVSLAHLQKQEHVLLMPVKNQTKWNDAIQVRVENARQMAASVDDPDKLADMALKAALADDYKTLYTQLAARFDKAAGRSQAIRQGRPSLGADGRPEDRSAADKPNYKEPRSGEEIADVIAARGFQ